MAVPFGVLQVTRFSVCPFALTVKFPGTLFGGLSRVPQSTSAETSYLQFATPVGMVLK